MERRCSAAGHPTPAGPKFEPVSGSGQRGAAVVVVGSINVDTTMTVERLPTAGETLLATSARTTLGGKGANQAVAARRQGVPSALVGAVGGDDAGAGARRALLAEGLDLGSVVTRAGEPTGAAHIAVDRAGANTIIVAPGANATLSPPDVRGASATIEASRVMLVQLEIPDDAVIEALRLGRAAGTTTILNPAPARPLPPSLLRLCDVVVPNEPEAGALTGETDRRAAVESLRRLAPDAVVIVTCGADGAVVAGPDLDGVISVPASRVAVVDTVAAGDAFCGVLAAALATRHPLLEAVRRAGAGGAHAATVAGALPSLPTAADVERILRA